MEIKSLPSTPRSMKAGGPMIDASRPSTAVSPLSVTTYSTFGEHMSARNYRKLHPENRSKARTKLDMRDLRSRNFAHVSLEGQSLTPKISKPESDRFPTTRDEALAKLKVHLQRAKARSQGS